MQWKSICMVIPAYNEEANIGEAIKTAVSSVRRHTPEYEIIVVDDGSRDSTYAVASKIAGENKRIKVLRHETNKGVGEALKTGFRNAGCDLIYWFPADNQVGAGEIDKFLPFITGADIVAGFRKKGLIQSAGLLMPDCIISS